MPIDFIDLKKKPTDTNPCPRFAFKQHNIDVKHKKWNLAHKKSI